MKKYVPGHCSISGGFQEALKRRAMESQRVEDAGDREGKKKGKSRGSIYKSFVGRAIARGWF